jgi:hypothetical protein
MQILISSWLCSLLTILVFIKLFLFYACVRRLDLKYNTELCKLQNYQLLAIFTC